MFKIASKFQPFLSQNRVNFQVFLHKQLTPQRSHMKTSIFKSSRSARIFKILPEFCPLCVFRSWSRKNTTYAGDFRLLKKSMTSEFTNFKLMSTASEKALKRPRLFKGNRKRRKACSSQISLSRTKDSPRN